MVNIRAFPQEAQWVSAKNWRLYEINNKRDYALPIDSLGKFKFMLLNLDTLNSFLELAEKWPKEKYSMWMGRYLCTCEIDGVKRKVDISVYGGFFFDEYTRTYFQIPKPMVDDWIGYWNVTYARF